MRNFLFHDGQNYYKPWATRTPVLLILLLVTSILIFLTELACRSIPAHNGYGEYGDLANNTLRQQLKNTWNTTQSVPPAPSSSLLSPTPSQTQFTPTASVSGTFSSWPTASSEPSKSNSGSESAAATTDTDEEDSAPTTTESTFSISGGPAPFPGNYLPTESDIPEAPTEAPTSTSYMEFINPETSDYLRLGDGAMTALDSAPTDGIGLADDGNNSAQLAGDYLSTADGKPTIPAAGRPSPVAATATDTGFPIGKHPPSRPTIGPILVVDSNGHTMVFTPTAPPAGAAGPSNILTVVGGKTFIESPNEIATGTDGKPLAIFTVIGDKIFTEAPSPVSTVINGQTYSALQIPLLTIISGHTFTEIAAAVSTGFDHVPFERTKSAIIPIATIVNFTGTFFDWSNGESTISSGVTLRQYLLVSVVPLILATFYTIPWKIVDNTIREMEPFYQLNQFGGATAENSLCLDYATTVLFSTPFKAFRQGHFVVLWSSLISLAAMFLPSLVSEAIFVSMTGTCSPPIDHNICHSAWAVYPRLIRAIQALLSFIVILLVFMIVYGFRRKSGVYSEPLSIAGLVSLLSNSPALDTFQRIDSTTKKRQLQRLLSGKRFAISEFFALGQGPSYGIIELEAEVPVANKRKWLSRKKKGAKQTVKSESESPSDLDRTAEEDVMKPRLRISRIWWDIRLKLYYYLAIFFLGGLFVLITFYFFTRGNSGFENWMDSNSYGLRFAWTGLGTAIKLFWNFLDQDLRRNEPYHRLLLGSSQPADSILVPVYMSPFSAIIPSLRRRHFLVSLVCFASVLAEFLPICLGNIPYTPALTYRAFVTCSILSMTILLFMIACIVVLILRPRRRVRPLPRRTNTLASVCCYVASGESSEGGALGMLDQLSGLSKKGTKERDDIVVERGGLYAMGIVKGDGLRVDCDGRITRLWSD